MMPKVGHRITVTGVLASAKLGWIVRFEGWGVYIYAVDDAENSRMKALDGLEGRTVRVTGTLRYSAGSSSQRDDAATVPEHFFFDVAEAKLTGARPAAKIKSGEMLPRKPPSE
jgi:hypothetical protein